MNKKLGRMADLFFSLILISGVVYTSLLLIGLQKIIPGFSMHLIFLMDSLKYNNFGNDFGGLWHSPTFLVNILAGPVLIGLTGHYLRAVIETVKQINKTKKFMASLKAIKINSQYTVFKSTEELIFTGGFLKPQIFVSSAVFKSHTAEELKAMLWHEQNHKDNYHPLKLALANFVKSTLPSFPGVSYLFDNFLTMTEVSSDHLAEAVMKDKKPIVSALLKFHNSREQLAMSYFNSQRERIKILVGQKKESWTRPMAFSSLLVAVFLIGTVTLQKSTIFYDCQHLIKCVELLVTPPAYSQTSPASDHCQ